MPVDTMQQEFQIMSIVRYGQLFSRLRGPRVELQPGSGHEVLRRRASPDRGLDVAFECGKGAREGISFTWQGPCRGNGGGGGAGGTRG